MSRQNSLLALLSLISLELAFHIECSATTAAAVGGTTAAVAAATGGGKNASAASGTTAVSATTQALVTVAALAQTTLMTASQQSDATASWFCRSPIEYRQSQVAGSFFCENFTSYWAACNLGDPSSCSDVYVRYAYNELENMLSLYSCDSYSRIWDCDDCLLAYQRWMCATSFKQCNDSAEVCGGVGNPAAPNILPTCVRKTCQDVCFDVMRKCPPEIAFICPPQNDQREYLPPGSVCNNLQLPPPNLGFKSREISFFLHCISAAAVLFLLSAGIAF